MSTGQWKTAVAANLTSKQLLLFVFALRSVCQYSMAEENHAAQRQAAVTAYLKSKQLLLFNVTGIAVRPITKMAMFYW